VEISRPAALCCTEAVKPLQAWKRKAAALNASFKKLFSYLVADVRIRSDIIMIK